MPPGTAFARVQVFETAEGALPGWGALEAIAPASLYQTRRWLTAWMATIGAARSITPMLVLASDRDNCPLLFLPLGVETSFGLNVARCLGGRDANFNIPLCRPGLEWSARDLATLLRVAARLPGRAPDLFELTNQAESWEGSPNPFMALAHQPSPSFGYRTQLFQNPEDFLRAHISSDTRKKLRAKWRKLNAIGQATFLSPPSHAASTDCLTAYCRQKAARFEALGLPVDVSGAQERAFLAVASTASNNGGEPAVEWYGLKLGERIIATFAGGVHRGRWHGMVTSFDMSADVAVASPGELLAQHLTTHVGLRGLQTLDLGIGEARYKSQWCDIAEPMFDCIVAVSWRGRLLAPVQATWLNAKRMIKQNASAWAAVQRWRKWKARFGR